MNASSLSPKAILMLVLALVTVVAASNAFYSYRLTTTQRNIESVVNNHGDQLQKLNRGLNESKQAYAAVEDELSSAQQRLGSTQVELRKAQQSSAQLARTQKQTVSKWGTQMTQLQQAQAATKGEVGNISTDLAGVKTNLSTASEQIASTRSDLQRAVGDLGIQSGLIARNRTDLDELRLRGERDYYEFNVNKSKQPQRVGTIGIALKKTDAKRQRYTINVISDDRTIEKKDRTANEPVQFYQSGYHQPTEIVVNEVSKDRIAGYIAVPKKRDARTQTGAVAQQPSGAVTMNRIEQEH
jgi:hypothetical protein